MSDGQVQNAPALLRQALTVHQSGDLFSAQRLYEQILATQPGHFDALHLLGVLCMQKGDPDRAVSLISQALLINTQQQAAYSNRGAAYLVLKNYQSALTDFDNALALSPDNADAHYNKGNALLEMNQAAEALASFDKAIALRPQFADAHLMRGLALARDDKQQHALDSYTQACALNPKSAEAHFNRGNALNELGRLSDAVEAYTEVLGLRPDHTDALNNRGNALRHLKQTDAAISDFNKAITLNPSFVGAQLNRAMCLLAVGDYSKGWAAYEWRFKTPELEPVTRAFSKPRWYGPEGIEGKTILLIAEQGLGDTLQFCRFAPLVANKGARVVLSVQPSLVSLLSKLPGIDAVFSAGDAHPDFDVYCPLLSLPHALGTTIETIPSHPYLQTDPEKVAVWSSQLSEHTGLRVGLVWAGSARKGQPNAHAIDLKRSLPLEAFETFADVQNVTFVSLQKGEPAAQLQQLKAKHWRGPKLIDETSSLHDFADTAALITNLDLVITCDTAVAHLAGGLGKAVWILNRFDGCWRWLNGRTDTPWYPTARLFQQPSPGDWRSVIAAVKHELLQKAKT